jgi:hypothetical protein
MNKIEEICQKFLLLKKRFEKSEINFLCNHSYRSITGQMKGLYKDEISPNKIDVKKKSYENQLKKSKDNIYNNKSHSKSINKSDCLRKMIMTLESSNKKTKNENDNKTNIIKNTNTKLKTNDKNKSITPSAKDISDNSPTIINDEDINKKKGNEDLETISNNNIINLNEEEEKSNNNNNENKKQKYNKYSSINIIDKDDKTLNIKDIIINNFSWFGTQLGKLTERVPKINSIEAFYNEQREKIISVNLKNGDFIQIEAIKKIIHLFFNILSKIFKCLTKETENTCILCLNNIFDIINLVIDYIKTIKKFIKNNNNNIDILFLKDIKIIGNYCIYVLYIKKYNYEYMLEVQNKKENDKINTFFNNYLKYFKTVNKIKIILKDNNMFIKHFAIQPTMISYVDLFEMNRKIINYQLNVNYK